MTPQDKKQVVDAVANYSRTRSWGNMPTDAEIMATATNDILGCIDGLKSVGDIGSVERALKAAGDLYHKAGDYAMTGVNLLDDAQRARLDGLTSELIALHTTLKAAQA